MSGVSTPTHEAVTLETVTPETVTPETVTPAAPRKKSRLKYFIIEGIKLLSLFAALISIAMASTYAISYTTIIIPSLAGATLAFVGSVILFHMVFLPEATEPDRATNIFSFIDYAYLLTGTLGLLGALDIDTKIMTGQQDRYVGFINSQYQDIQARLTAILIQYCETTKQ
jgi:hypothetical protein